MYRWLNEVAFVKAFVSYTHIVELEKKSLGSEETFNLTEIRRISTLWDGGNRYRYYRFHEVQGINGEHLGIITLTFVRIYKNLWE